MAIQAVSALQFRGVPVRSHYSAGNFLVPGHGFYTPLSQLLELWQHKDDPPPVAKLATRTTDGRLIFKMIPLFPVDHYCISCQKFMGRSDFDLEKRVETDAGAQYLFVCPHCNKAYKPNYL